MTDLTLVFDVETTGVPPRRMPPTDPAYPRLVEVAMVLLDEATGKVEATAALVVAPDGFEVPDEAAAVHGITTAVAREAGVPVRVALAVLTNLRRRATRLVGHNVLFDVNLIWSELHRLEQDGAVLFPTTGLRCTAELGEPVAALPPTPRMIEVGFGNKNKKPTLAELHVALFGTGFDGAHRALSDVHATIACWLELRRRGVGA